MTESHSAESGGAEGRLGVSGTPDALPFDAVLFDRDGTLVVDVPYNTDPRRVAPMPTAVETVRRLREAGVLVGVVTNQSGVGRGLITVEQLRAVHSAIDDAIGPLDVWEVCPHAPDAGCACRKPQPGLILSAMARLGVEPSRTLVIGDIGSDLDAATAAGASAVLVPNAATRPEEVDAAELVAPDLASAVELAFGGALRGAAGAEFAGETALRPAETETHTQTQTQTQAETETETETTIRAPRLRTSRRRYDPRPETTVNDHSLDPETVVSAAAPRADARPKGRPHVLVARLDSMGDVLLAGPAVRAIAASGARVTMLCSPRGASAARMLPGVDDVLVWDCPWVSADAPDVDQDDTRRLVQAIAAARFTQAVILTSFHQSPLPLALLLRLAGMPRIGGASVDYAGSLLDMRLRPGDEPGDDLPESIPEAERALRIAAACGFRLPESDPGLLAVRNIQPQHGLPRPYVVLHPGASAPARRWGAAGFAAVASALAELGVNVVVTGDAEERELTREVACTPAAIDLGGRLTLPKLAGVLADAEAIVCGNTGPAHLAAAVGTPVVSLFSPVVPAAKWAPYGVPCALLGDQGAACAGSRARVCPVAGHPCLAGVTPQQVVDACLRLAPQLTPDGSARAQAVPFSGAPARGSAFRPETSGRGRHPVLRNEQGGGPTRPTNATREAVAR